MPYECPECKETPFEITSKIRLPADGYSDEMSLFIFECKYCKFEVIGLAEESRHGNLSRESWHITGYIVENKSIKKIKRLDYQLSQSYIEKLQLSDAYTIEAAG